MNHIGRTALRIIHIPVFCCQISLKGPSFGDLTDRLTTDRLWTYPVRPTVIVTMDQKNLKRLGKNVRLMRLKRQWTQEKLAAVAEIHPVYVSYIEKGTRNPSITKIFQIAIALECSPIEIFRGIF